MEFHCDKCGREYRIADDKVRGKTLNVKCLKCKESMVVTGSADSKVVSTAGPMHFQPAIVRDRFDERVKPAFEKLNSMLAADAPNARSVHQGLAHFVKEVRDLDEMVAKWSEKRP